ncbi:FecR family protein [Aquimarina algiphila]|uniref:FecR family protein n=1 Tax=Aquimarina algiphila TaxID=2047982 RepID=UPI0023305FFE|nr:FecR family protein [Aquimarina algiphila]
MNKEYLIEKWLIGELTEEELEAFKKLDDYDMHIKIMEGARNFKASEVSEVADLDSFYAKLDQQKTPAVEHNTWYKPFLKIAAAFAILVGIGSLFFINSNTNIETMISEKISVELPDASTAMLNSKSEITFNKNDWTTKREVTLEGEAFFKVAKGSKFDVITDAGKVSVLGTQFNVKNREGYFEVQCFEGLVNVKYKNHIKKLPAGKTFKVVKGMITSDTTLNQQPEWMSNVSSFKSVPFYVVINEFERQYDVVFSLENIDTSRIFTGGFVHTNLEEGLKSITLPLDLNYTLDSTNNIKLFKDKPKK